MIRTLRKTTEKQRLAILQRASFNTGLIPQAEVYIDLKTDGGTAARNVADLAFALEADGIETNFENGRQASHAAEILDAVAVKYFDFPYVIPVNIGRSAERVWCGVCLKAGDIVPGNLLFATTKHAIEETGAKLMEVPVEEAFDLDSEEPFKGNISVAGVRDLLEKHGKEKIPCVYLELLPNTAGGHPVSLGNLREIRKVLEAHSIPLFLDATRIVANSRLLQLREPECHGKSIAEITRETMSLCDAFTLSASKNFPVHSIGMIGTRNRSLFHLASGKVFMDGAQASSAQIYSLGRSISDVLDNDRFACSRLNQVTYLWSALKKGGIPVVHPCGGHAVFLNMKAFFPKLQGDPFAAQALAAQVYLRSGIRLLKGVMSSAEQRKRQIDLLRLVVPAERYTESHLDDVVAAVIDVFERRDKISGLKQRVVNEQIPFAPLQFEDPGWVR